MYVVLLVLSLFIYVSSLSDCILDDFTKTISTCDETSHTRSIKYIYNKNCQIKNESLIFYTKNPTVSIPCNKTCPPGQFLLYNPTLRKSQCEDCPMNTYSMGNDLNIQYWSSEIIDMFDISCSKADNTKETFDWIEIAIERIENAISDLDKIAGSVYYSFTTRNNKLKSELDRINTELPDIDVGAILDDAQFIEAANNLV